MGYTLSRRGVLRGAGAVGGISMLGTQVSGARGRSPLERYIVGTTAGNANIARRDATEVYRTFDFGDIGAAVSGWFPAAAINGLENHPAVRYIEPEGTMHAIGHATPEGDGDPSTEQVLPWGIDRVDADVAHHSNETGSGSSIAIIDSGIDPDHETLTVAGGTAFVSCADGCTEVWDDDHGHGTHCAGTADADDNGVGVVGVSTSAALYAVKVLDGSGSGTWSDVAAGIEWTADQGFDVASLSLGGGDSQTVADACAYAYGKGTLLVAAAGNDGSHPVFNTIGYPAAYDEVIAVSAIDENDDIASFSSRGPQVELAAPGVAVLSSLPGDKYDAWNGTSMACPHVSGAGAQLMANGYSHTQARARLNDTAEDIGLSSDEQGSGLVDVAAALDVEDDGGDPSVLALETHEAAAISESSATLHGELTDLGGADAADVSFEWRATGSETWTATAAQTLSSTGTFSDDVTGLDAGSEYEFHAVAETSDDAVTGATLTFTTDSGDVVGDNAPVIDTFDVAQRTTGPWARADVSWAVSDQDGDLDSVASELLDSSGTVLDSTSSDVSGSSASGEHNLRTRSNDLASIRLTVTDKAGNETSETK